MRGVGADRLAGSSTPGTDSTHDYFLVLLFKSYTKRLEYHFCSGDIGSRNCKNVSRIQFATTCSDNVIGI